MQVPSLRVIFSSIQEQYGTQPFPDLTDGIERQKPPLTSLQQKFHEQFREVVEQLSAKQPNDNLSDSGLRDSILFSDTIKSNGDLLESEENCVTMLYDENPDKKERYFKDPSEYKSKRKYKSNEEYEWISTDESEDETSSESDSEADDTLSDAHATKKDQNTIPGYSQTEMKDIYDSQVYWTW